MQILRKFLTAQIFLLFLTGALSAQKVKFTLDEAIKTALENNREVLVANMNVEKAEAAVGEAFGYALPSVDVTASFAHFLQKPKMAFPDFESLLTNATYSILFDENVIPRDDSKYKPLQTKLQSFAQTNSFETKAQITQILFNSAVFRGIGASKIYLDLARVQLKSTVSKTILDVKKAFYGVLLAQELYEIMKASLTNAEDNLKSVQALNRQGLTSDFDALQVEVQVENLRPKVDELKNVLENAKNGLKILLGLDQNSQIDVDGKFNYTTEILPDNETAVDNAMFSNLDIKSLVIKKQVDEEFIAIERADYWPTIAAFGNYSFSGSADDFKFQTYNSSVVGLSFSLNLFRGGQVSHRVQQAEISTMQTEQQISVLKDFTATQVKSKILELEKVKKQVDALEKNVSLAEKAYSIAVTRYDEGSGTQLEIKNADVELRTARTNRIKAIHDYIIAKAELDQLLGLIEENYTQHIKYQSEN